MERRLCSRAVLVMTVLPALLAAACGGEGPGEQELTVDRAAALIQERLPERQVSVQGVRPEQGRAVASTDLDGTPVDFIFDRTGEGDWRLVEVELEGNTFAIGDLTQLSQTMQQMVELAMALERFKEANGAYPVGEGSEALQALVPDFVTEDSVASDAWQRDLQYVSDSGEDYTLVSFGPDGRQGTRDDLVLVSGVFL